MSLNWQCRSCHHDSDEEMDESNIYYNHIKRIIIMNIILVIALYSPVVAVSLFIAQMIIKGRNK